MEFPTLLGRITNDKDLTHIAYAFAKAVREGGYPAGHFPVCTIEDLPKTGRGSVKANMAARPYEVAIDFANAHKGRVSVLRVAKLPQGAVLDRAAQKSKANANTPSIDLKDPRLQDVFYDITDQNQRIHCAKLFARYLAGNYPKETIPVYKTRRYGSVPIMFLERSCRPAWYSPEALERAGWKLDRNTPAESPSVARLADVLFDC